MSNFKDNSCVPRPKEQFKTVEAGEWVQPIRNGYRMKCCDCGLVHRLFFKLVKYGDNKHKIRFKAYRE